MQFIASRTLSAVSMTASSIPSVPYTTTSLTVAYLAACKPKCRRLTFWNVRGFGSAKRVSPVAGFVTRICEASNEETRRPDGEEGREEEREPALSERELEVLVEDEVADDQESDEEALLRRSAERDESARVGA